MLLKKIALPLTLKKFGDLPLLSENKFSGAGKESNTVKANTAIKF